MAEGDVVSSDPSDWHYLSEGGASIVFSYDGPPHPTLSNTVLRLRKSPKLPSSNSNETQDEDDEAEDPSVAFQHAVTSHLLATAFLPRLQPVPVSTEWLAKLAEIAEQHRPTRRRAVDQIDLHRKTAVLATNLVGHEGLAVEIKPKWGFLPRSTHLSPHTRARKSHHCRFCMHAQYLSSSSSPKSDLEDKNDTTTTAATAATGSAKAEGYCPLDLYSGDEGRVQSALGALWDAWVVSGGKVNNLKVFVAGKKLDPNEVTDMNLLAKILSLSSSPPPESELKLKEAFIATLLPTLLKTPVLRQLAHLQRTLDPLDIEGLFALYLLARGGIDEDTPLEELYPEPDLVKWEDFVAVYRKANPIPHRGLELSSFTSTSKSGAKDVDAEKEEEKNQEVEEEQEWEPTFVPENLYYFTLAYLLSATFKDCSLMLRPPLPSSSEGGSAHVGSITVIDLDPKSIKRLRKWYNLDRTIVDAFEERESGDGDGTVRVCVDAFAPVYR